MSIFSNDTFMRGERTVVIDGSNSVIYIGLQEDKHGFALIFSGDLIMRATGKKGQTMHLWEDTSPYSLTQAKRVLSAAADIVRCCGMHPTSDLNKHLWDKAIAQIDSMRRGVFLQLPDEIRAKERFAA